MNRKFDNILLIFVTISFVIVGAVVIFFTFDRVINSNSCTFNGKLYSVGDVIEGYEKDSSCVCENGAIVCTKLSDIVTIPDLNQFVRINLDVEPKYISVGTKEPLVSLPLKTMFTSISKSGDILKITIEQEQKCTTDLRIPVQVGMYYIKNNQVYITNIVNKDKKFQTDCIVSVSYKISKIKSLSDNFVISYIGEDKTEVKASICNYEGKIYSEADNYSASDNCNICTCLEGVSKCSNDRVCTTK